MNIPSTIQEDIENNTDVQISHRTLNTCAYLKYETNWEVIKIPMNNMINKYKEYFDPYIEEYEVDDDDERRYLYSPKKLSQDLYQTTEYWSILLYINECHSILDFKPHGTIKVVNPGVITELLNEILIQEGVLT